MNAQKLKETNFYVMSNDQLVNLETSDYEKASELSANGMIPALGMRWLTWGYSDKHVSAVDITNPFVFALTNFKLDIIRTMATEAVNDIEASDDFAPYDDESNDYLLSTYASEYLGTHQADRICEMFQLEESPKSEWVWEAITELESASYDFLNGNIEIESELYDCSLSLGHHEHSGAWGLLMYYEKKS